MKSIVKAVGKCKMNRMQKIGSPVFAERLSLLNYERTILFSAVLYGGYIYAYEQTKDKNFSTQAKRYPTWLVSSDWKRVVYQPINHTKYL